MMWGRKIEVQEHHPSPSVPLPSWGPHTQQRDTSFPPHHPKHTHFPCLSAPEQWSKAPCGSGGGCTPVLPFWVVFTSPFSSLPSVRPLGILQTQEEHRPLQANSRTWER